MLSTVVSLFTHHRLLLVIFSPLHNSSRLDAFSSFLMFFFALFKQIMCVFFSQNAFG